VEALGELGDRALPFVAKLAKALTDKSPAVRKEAAQALGNIGENNSARVGPYAPDLAKLLSDTQNPSCRKGAAMALGTLSKYVARYGESLAELFNADESDVRYAGMAAFEALKRSLFFGCETDDALAPFVPRFFDRMSDDFSCVRTQAADMLGALERHTIPLRDKIVDLVHSASAPGHRAAAVLALGVINVNTMEPRDSDVELIAKLAKDADKEVRQSVARVLRELSSCYSGVRVAAHVSAFKDLLGGEDAVVRLTMKDACRQLIRVSRDASIVATAKAALEDA